MKPGTNYFGWTTQLEYSEKNANVYKTNFLILNFKSTCIILLKAKLLAKAIELSIGNKKVVVKKKNIMFLVNSCHILLAHFLL